jgi:Protein of unknown function (DUF2652)
LASSTTAPTGAAAAGARARGALLLADISGYTGFLQGVADAHRAIVIEADEPPAAYSLMSSLLDRIVTTLEPGFRLAKLEGDAVFAMGLDGTAPHGDELVACLRACHAAFAERLAEANSIWSCTCGACSRVGDLDLKFVLHHGDAIVARIAGSEELLGPDVNTAHRLLKNHVKEKLGRRPYALITDSAMRALEIPSAGMTAITETYDQIPAIEAHVLALG